jgi:hypothetical protein
MIRNQEIMVNQIQNQLQCELLNLRMDITLANYKVLDETLAENSITFVVGEDHEEPPIESPMASTYCDKLPRVYFGIEKDDELNVGLKFARTGSTTHSDFTQ